MREAIRYNNIIPFEFGRTYLYLITCLYSPSYQTSLQQCVLEPNDEEYKYSLALKLLLSNSKLPLSLNYSNRHWIQTLRFASTNYRHQIIWEIDTGEPSLQAEIILSVSALPAVLDRSLREISNMICNIDSITNFWDELLQLIPETC